MMEKRFEKKQTNKKIIKSEEKRISKRKAFFTLATTLVSGVTLFVTKGRFGGTPKVKYHERRSGMLYCYSIAQHARSSR